MVYNILVSQQILPNCSLLNSFFYRYAKQRYLGRSNRDEMRHGYPTFVDMMGFQNDENVNEFLEGVFEGRVREGTEFRGAQEQR